MARFVPVPAHINYFTAGLRAGSSLLHTGNSRSKFNAGWAIGFMANTGTLASHQRFGYLRKPVNT